MDWKRPLSGLVVLDLSEGIAAAFTGRIFAQLGAIVRRPAFHDTVDTLREIRYATTEFQVQVDEYLHAGKIKSKQAIDINNREEIISLLDGVDFVIQDHGKELAHQITSANNRVRVISLADYGWDGPHHTWRSDSLVMQAISGISTLVGDPRREPLMLPGFVTQYTAGMLAFISGIALRMNPTMRDRHVLVTEIEAASTLHQYSYLAYTRLAWVRKRGQFMLPTATYFRCTDGDVLLAAVRPNQWQALAITCDRPELLARPDLKTMLDRRLQAKLIETELSPWFEGRSCKEAFEALCAAGVPTAIVKTPAQASGDAQFAWRNFIERDGDNRSSVPLPFFLNGVRPAPLTVGVGSER